MPFRAEVDIYRHFVPEHLWPMLISLSPKDTPGVSESIIKPVMRLPAPAALSVTARTNIQLETPAFVIHNLEPLMTLHQWTSHAYNIHFNDN